jgi:hypothetical protein
VISGIRYRLCILTVKKIKTFPKEIMTPAYLHIASLCIIKEYVILYFGGPFLCLISTIREHLWWGSQKEGDHWEDQDVGGWTGSIWLRIGTSGGLL